MSSYPKSNTSPRKWWCHHSQRCNHKIVKYEDKRNALALPKRNTCIHHKKKCEDYCYESQSVVYPSFFFIYALILLVATPNTDDLWCNGYQKRNYQKLFSNISTSSGSHWYNEILDSCHFFRSKIYNFNIEPIFYKNRIIHPALYMSFVWRE